MSIYQNKQRSVEDRVEDLLSQMTIGEKVGQLCQTLRGWHAYVRNEDHYDLTDAFREQVELFDGMGAMYGLFRADPWSRVTFENGIKPGDSYKVANLIQRYVLENTRLGIPVLFTEESSHGHQSLGGTMFPTNIGVGSTWNLDLYEQAATYYAKEIRCKGAHLGLLAGLDIIHDPRWGRSEECYGEDPYLSASMISAGVRGLQGAGSQEMLEHDRIVAVVKHFAGQGAGMGGHNAAPAPIGERELREIHLPGMKSAVEAGALGCMAAYNEIDGVPCHANRKLLNGILRGEWGFEGIVMADGSALNRLLDLVGDNESAAALALDSGVDVSLFDQAFPTLENAIRMGKTSEEALNQAVRRILNIKFRMGLFDENRFVEYNAPTYHAIKTSMKPVNERMAQESIVLLKNDRELLPLDRQKVGRIAVIGPNADVLYNQLGDYTPSQSTNSGVTVLQGIRQAVGQSTQVDYAQGCGIRGIDKDGFTEALRIAEQSDTIIMALGGCSTRDFSGAFDASNGAALLSGPKTDMDCGENVDVADLALGGRQMDLVREIAKTGKPIVAVLIQGRPYAISELSELCTALICAWYPGQEGGTAIARTLFGDCSPSGKLPVSIPRTSAQLPVYYNKKPMYDRYLDMPSKPLYPFGYGLSYTSFQYVNLQVEQPVLDMAALENGRRFAINVELQNVGARRSAEVVQLYVRDLQASVTRRVRELKGFRKVWLDPGEKVKVRLEIGQEELSIWNADMKYVVEPGEFEVIIGTGEETYLSTMIEVKG